MTRLKTDWLVDTTLRDGEQAPGVVFSPDERLKIATLLSVMGVSEIEVGTPAMGKAEQASIRQIIALNLPARVSGWCRASSVDLAAAARCGLCAVNMSIPGSALLLDAMGKDTAWRSLTLASCMQIARRHFEFVSLGIQDASRMECDALDQLVERCCELGVDRVRLADTVGLWTPEQVTEVFTRVRRVTGNGIKLGFHGHNDIGLATANSSAALCAGADCTDVTVNGLGERAGNACLAEVVMVMSHGYGMNHDIDATKLKALSDYVSLAANRTLPPDKPLVGSAVFQHESGIHIRGILADSRTYEPFSPSTTGHQKRTMVFGRHSGLAAVRHLLTSHGITLHDSDILNLLSWIRQQSVETKSFVRVPDILERVTCSPEI